MKEGAHKHMKRAVLSVRVSTPEQSAEPQLLDLRQMAAARGYEIVREYGDKLSGTKSNRPGLDALLSDAQRHRFDVVMVWAFDRMARAQSRIRVQPPFGAGRATATRCSGRALKLGRTGRLFPSAQLLLHLRWGFRVIAR